jgi:hypothetical protein
VHIANSHYHLVIPTGGNVILVAAVLYYSGSLRWAQNIHQVFMVEDRECPIESS